MHIAATAIPILTGAALWAAFLARQHDWRVSFLSASLVWGIFLVAVTEILSWLGAITFRFVLAAWTLGLLLALGWAARSFADLRAVLRRVSWPKMAAWEAGLLAGCVLIAVLLGVTAWAAPPNTYDAMTYHMPRVMHWIQDRTVAFYPTNMLAQLFLTPGAEYYILHFQLLAGSDRLANFAEWFSMLGSAVGVSLIARGLGASRRGQIYAALSALTIPMGILQASSTQDNLVTAFWLVSFVFWMRGGQDKEDWLYTAAAAASLGLAALCKATAYVFALPFVAWWGLDLLKKHGAKGGYRVALIGLVFLLINAGTYIRNYGLFGNPLGISEEVSIRHPDISYKYSNDVFSPQALASNIVRNTALHLGTPFEDVNSALSQGIRSLHGVLGIAPDDTRTTWAQSEFEVPKLSFDENTDGALLPLLAGTIVVLVMLARRDRKPELLIYSLCVLLGFVGFCFILKWQLFHARLQLPLFILFAAVVGTVLDQLKKQWVPNAISAVLLLGALPWALLNQNRPLLGERNVLNTGRNDLYFQAQPPILERSYVNATQFVARELKGQCGRVGIYLDHNDYEYPIWFLMAQKVDTAVEVESVEVENISSKTYSRFPEFTPCAILVSTPIKPQAFSVNGQPYEEAWSSEVISVFVPK